MIIPFNIENDIPVMESFDTIQGEGFHAGRAAYFIRLAGCTVGCHWCDVKESWDVHSNQIRSIASLVDEVLKSKINFVVITGGEPAMYDLTALTKALKAVNCEIAIETSGCYPVKGMIDWFCFSPKKFKPPIQESYLKANELKIVVNHKSDLSWAEDHAKKVNPRCYLFLQPEWSKLDATKSLIIEYVKGNISWRISLQTHKFLNIP